jgi:ribonuclease P protein component
MSLRLRPVQRVRKPQQFETVIQKGKFIKGVFLNLWTYRDAGKSAGNEAPLLGVMVGRKTDKRAPKRNLWKRRIREAFRRNQTLMKEDLTVIIQSRICPGVPTYQEIESEMKWLLQKTGGLK